MTPKRQIITADNLIFIDLGTHYSADCAALASAGIAFVADHNGARWIEREPFTGRVTQIDAATAAEIDRLFADADQQHLDHLAAIAEAEQGEKEEGGE